MRDAPGEFRLVRRRGTLEQAILNEIGPGAEA
jgi:hypothetical protein